MSLLLYVVYPAVVAVLLTFTIGRFLTWLVKSEQGRIAFIAIVGFVAFVAASGILG